MKNEFKSKTENMKAKRRNTILNNLIRAEACKQFFFHVSVKIWNDLH